MADNTNSLDYECDWRLGFNFNPSTKGTIGYLTFWSGCGGLGLSKDVEVYNPFSGVGQTIATGATIKCVGILESFHFTGDSDAPIRMVAYVSKETAANVRAKLAAPVCVTSVQVAWYIVSYDNDRKQWFEAAFVKDNARAQSFIDVEDGVLQLFIDSKPSLVDERLDINVYRLEFQILPSEDTSTLLEFATGPTQRLVKEWAAD